MRTPALDLWREEVRTGRRDRLDFDALFKAACCEASALEFSGIPELAAACRDDARRIILEAAKRQRTAA